MKRVSVFVIAAVVALCMALPLAGCSTEEYTPQLKAQTVDDSALNEAGTLRVGVNASNAPYAAESNGSIVGLDVDIAAALADSMGLKLELVDVGTNADGSFTKENVDIVMGVSKAGTSYRLSTAYLQSGIALFSLTQGAQAPTETGSFTVAAQSSSMSAWEVSDHYGDSVLENAIDLQSAFESLNTGAVNYVAADSVIGEFSANQAGVLAYPIALLQDPSSYCIAYATSNTTLGTAIEDSLSTLITGGVVSLIEQKWLGSEHAGISGLSVIEATATADETESTEGDGESSADSADSSSSSTTGTETSSGSGSASTGTDSTGSSTSSTTGTDSSSTSGTGTSSGTAA